MRGTLAAVLTALPGLAAADAVAGMLTEWQEATCEVVAGCLEERCSMPQTSNQIILERDADREGDDWRVLEFMDTVSIESDIVGPVLMRPFASEESARNAMPIPTLNALVFHLIYPVESSTAQQLFDVVFNVDDPDQIRFRIICQEGLP